MEYFFMYNAMFVFTTRMYIIQYVSHAHNSWIKSLPLYSELIDVPRWLLGGLYYLCHKYSRVIFQTYAYITP